MNRTPRKEQRYRVAPRLSWQGGRCDLTFSRTSHSVTACMMFPRVACKRLLFFWVGLFLLASTFGQTVFVDFNTTGQYTNNFNPWNDTGTGVNGGNYAFAENSASGVGSSRGVSVLNNNDTTACYKSGSWNLATNGATVIVSTLIYADGQTSGDKVQLGVMNTNLNGLNNNAGVAFETFRFIPQSPTSWQVFEQYRSANTLTTSASLGTISVVSNHWYKFVVGVTNTSGASGNIIAGCALYDYGADGLTPGANLITFSTATSHAALNIATNTAVWPALRAYQDAGISAWDNFLVFTSNGPPVMTLAL